jgi:hypothetical protein
MRPRVESQSHDGRVSSVGIKRRLVHGPDTRCLARRVNLEQPFHGQEVGTNDVVGIDHDRDVGNAVSKPCFESQ